MNSLKCPLCCEIFDNSNRLPLILPKCGHTYCKDCIKKNFKQENQFQCLSDGITYLDT